jgi:hypothetical protein
MNTLDQDLLRSTLRETDFHVERGAADVHNSHLTSECSGPDPTISLEAVQSAQSKLGQESELDATIGQSPKPYPVYTLIPEGQERLATQLERDGVNRIINERVSQNSRMVLRNSTNAEMRGAGDHLNRFLLCALISESARRIKVSAAKLGEPLSMISIVKGVLRSYNLAAEDRSGPLSKPELDIPALKRMNEKILLHEVARNSQDRVKASEARLAHAHRMGDNTTIRAEREVLVLAKELQDRLAQRFR